MNSSQALPNTSVLYCGDLLLSIPNIYLNSLEPLYISCMWSVFLTLLGRKSGKRVWIGFLESSDALLPILPFSLELLHYQEGNQ